MKDFAVVFDIDGTIANIEHRQHWVKSKPKNWAAFNAGVLNDTLHEDIRYVMKTFQEAGHPILIASGRGEELRANTEAWLESHSIVHKSYPVWEGVTTYQKLYMRPAKDNRKDSIIKTEIYHQMIVDGYKPHFVFDDRDSVVKAWRDLGLRCFQVAPGDF